MEQDKTSIDDGLGEDHQRLGGLLEHLRAAVARRSADARDLLKSFSADLLHHMTWEEADLFPAVRARANAAQQRSIESLEIDHQRLRDTMAELRTALVEGDFGFADHRIDWLETLLKGHNYDEEHGVYEEADRLLSSEERRSLLENFRRKT
jgi:hemerythrin-like domain-containing protein